VKVVNVKYKQVDPIKWKAEGGSDDPSLFQTEEDHSDTTFWYRYLYHGTMEELVVLKIHPKART
jgi:DNA (cytosine-5)-methyltransferase 1